jgi:hypothetical protein
MVSNNPLSVDEYGFVAKTSCTWCWRSDLCRLRYSLIFTGTYIVYNGNKDMKKTRRPGGGRKPSKPEYSAAKNLTQQMKAATELYTEKMSLQAIADALSLNPIKARKLLITAGVYKSDTAKLVQQTFGSFRSTQSYSAAVTSTMSALQLSRSSVTSYLPYEKGVYFPEEAEAANISAGAERQRHYRAVAALKKNPCEENLWKCVVAFRGYKFKTMSGLPFTYTLKKGRGDEFTKELWIDRREDSKSLAWSSVMLAYHNIGKIGEVVDRPKALGDIRGVSYIYGLFYRFGLIDVPDKAKEKMAKQ